MLSKKSLIMFVVCQICICMVSATIDENIANNITQIGIWSEEHGSQLIPLSKKEELINNLDKNGINDTTAASQTFAHLIITYYMSLFSNEYWSKLNENDKKSVNGLRLLTMLQDKGFDFAVVRDDWNQNLLHFLFSKMVNDKTMPRHIFDQNLLDFLLINGVKIDQEDKSQRTPLHSLMLKHPTLKKENNAVPVMYDVLKNKMTEKNFLQKGKATKLLSNLLDKKDKDGNSPADYAKKKGYEISETSEKDLLTQSLTALKVKLRLLADKLASSFVKKQKEIIIEVQKEEKSEVQLIKEKKIEKLALQIQEEPTLAINSNEQQYLLRLSLYRLAGILLEKGKPIFNKSDSEIKAFLQENKDSIIKKIKVTNHQKRDLWINEIESIVTLKPMPVAQRQMHTLLGVLGDIINNFKPDITENKTQEILTKLNKSEDDLESLLKDLEEGEQKRIENWKKQKEEDVLKKIEEQKKKKEEKREKRKKKREDNKKIFDLALKDGKYEQASKAAKQMLEASLKRLGRYKEKVKKLKTRVMNVLDEMGKAGSFDNAILQSETLLDTIKGLRGLEKKHEDTLKALTTDIETIKNKKYASMDDLKKADETIKEKTKKLYEILEGENVYLVDETVSGAFNDFATDFSIFEGHMLKLLDKRDLSFEYYYPLFEMLAKDENIKGIVPIQDFILNKDEPEKGIIKLLAKGVTFSYKAKLSKILDVINKIWKNTGGEEIEASGFVWLDDEITYHHLEQSSARNKMKSRGLYFPPTVKSLEDFVIKRYRSFNTNFKDEYKKHLINYPFLKVVLEQWASTFITDMVVASPDILEFNLQAKILVMINHMLMRVNSEILSIPSVLFDEKLEKLTKEYRPYAETHMILTQYMKSGESFRLSTFVQFVTSFKEKIIEIIKDYFNLYFKAFIKELKNLSKDKQKRQDYVQGAINKILSVFSPMLKEVQKRDSEIKNMLPGSEDYETLNKAGLEKMLEYQIEAVDQIIEDKSSYSLSPEQTKSLEEMKEKLVEEK